MIKTLFKYCLNHKQHWLVKYQVKGIAYYIVARFWCLDKTNRVVRRSFLGWELFPDPTWRKK